MTTTLYRKYRPTTFAEMVNQQHIRLTLQHALEQDRLVHAYLFTGPRGVGKTTVARILARAMSCLDRSGAEPCNKCLACRTMLAGNSLDLIEIDAASQTGVDHVRENVIQSARVAPAVGRYKIFIIDEVHMLSLSAFNALLKLLEEPPAHVAFMLATTEVHRIPETIISRTQRFDFKKLTVTDMAERLRQLATKEKRMLGDGVAERIARAGRGSMRDAESMLGQLFSFEEETIGHDVADLVLPRTDQAVVLGILTALINGQATTALDQFHQFCNDGGDIPTLIHELVLAARTILLASVDPVILKDAMADQEEAQLKEMVTLAGLRQTPFFVRLTEELLAAERQVNRVSFAELPVEVAIVKITATDEQPPVMPPAPPSQSNKTTPVIKPVPPASKKTRPTGTQLSLSTAKDAWQAVRATLEDQPSLKLSAQHAEVQSLVGDVLTIAVPFRLHRERLNQAKVHAMLAQSLQEILGQHVSIEMVQGTDVPPSPGPSSDRPSATPKKDAPASGELWDQVVASFQ